MFPSRITVYKLVRDLAVDDLNDLNEALAMQKYRPLSSVERMCDGFVPPMPRYREDCYAVVVGRSEQRWHRDFQLGDDDTFGALPQFNPGQFNFTGFGGGGDKDYDALVMRYYREEKHIVTSDIKRKVQQAVKRIEQEQDRKVYAKERAQLKEEFISKVLPAAQCNYKEVPIIILSAGYVVIGAVGKLADQAASNMRQVLGTFPIAVPRTKFAVPQVLTAIAKAQADGTFDRFVITTDFQMQELTEHPSVARCKNTDITNEHIQGFFREGKVMTHADLRWDEKVRFQIDPKLAIRRLNIDDTALEEAMGGESDEEDLAGAEYASALIETSFVVQMLGELLQLLGGEEEPAIPVDKAAPVVVSDLAAAARAGAAPKATEEHEDEDEEDAE